MRKPLRLTAVLLALCMAVTVLPPAAFAAGEVVFPENEDLIAFVDQQADGTTISLENHSVLANDTSGISEPWVISKSVTIQDGTISIRAGGIVLDADVTFRNVSLNFAVELRNAIIANGHTLTLENVQCGGISFNLFCGGLVLAGYEGFSKDIPAPGNGGEVIIRGSTNLQKEDRLGPGNIYAGNLSMGSAEGDDAPASQFTGNPSIRVEGSAGSTALGTIYACGAQQKIITGKPVIADPNRYTVSGQTRVSGAFPGVNGAGSAGTNLVYSGSGNEARPKLENISSLTVEAGNLKPAAGSGLSGADLAIRSGAVLNLMELGDLSIGSFQGGGALGLGESQTLRISGGVTGTASVGIGGVFGTSSQAAPTAGHPYIQAPSSGDGAFTLLPYGGRDVEWVRDGSGTWMVPASEEPPRVKSFHFLEKDVTVSRDELDGDVELELNVEASDFPALDYIPLTITVGGKDAKRTQDEDGYYTYSIGNLTMMFSGDNLFVTPSADGKYIIAIVVPSKYTVDGKMLSDSVTLTVGSPGPGVAAVPTANTGLKWTGQVQTGVREGSGYTLTGHTGTEVGSYTATATLESGYQWADGSTAPKTIAWSIAKADGPSAPRGLSAAAPTTEGGADGKITGTSSAMEYARSADFADGQDCADGETAGLSPAVYYVRIKETGTHEPGAAAAVTVPAFGAATVVSIAVSSTAHKTDYTVGEPLDVSGLTIEVSYSDGSKRSVPVTAEMVGGFDAGQAAESQTLTIYYEGRTAVYTIRIQNGQQPRLYQVTVNNSHAQVSGAGQYQAGQSVVIHAGRYSGYDFAGWEVTGVTLGSPASADAAFVMPEHDVSCLAIWRASSGGGSSGSSGGGSSDSSSDDDTATTTEKHGDGSITTTSTNKITGTVTQTTRKPNGAQIVVETRKDGTVTSTERAADGSTTKTVQKPDGSSETSVKRADGSTAQVSVSQSGRTEAEVTLSASGGAAGTVTLPVPQLPVTKDGAAYVTVHTGSARPVRVEIPAQTGVSGAVAVIVHPDGTETLVKTSLPTEGGVTLTVSDGERIKLVDNAKPFSDTSGSWAKDAIDFVSARELFVGRTASEFAPDAPMSRAMLMTVLARLDGADTTAGTVWYEKGMAWAMAQGISDGRNPDAYITREQLVTMLYRYAGSPAASGGALPFRDAEAVSGYARDAVYWAVENGIMNGYGDGSLMPDGSATRAQVAAILMRYVTLLNQ